MANRDFIKGGDTPPFPGAESDPLLKAYVYRLRRDALMVTASLYSRHERPSLEQMRMSLAFVQGQLCAAAVADPRLPRKVKQSLMAFQAQTVRENVAERRGARRRTHPEGV